MPQKIPLTLWTVTDDDSIVKVTTSVSEAEGFAKAVNLSKYPGSRPATVERLSGEFSPLTPSRQQS